ncbi:MAG: hypothetical protein DMF87_03615 [Acidobacteria bacterium]|nr:MAG: hypothetical protein DMF87_03615 [Acidobacteriota bacterium]
MFAFFRPAQYFFIRALTAFRCAADIFERFRLRGGVVSSAAATFRADFAAVRLAVVERAVR